MFTPPNARQRTPPVCRCAKRCPKILCVCLLRTAPFSRALTFLKRPDDDGTLVSTLLPGRYTPTSVDETSSEYGSKVTVACSDSTSDLCSPQTWMGWPESLDWCARPHMMLHALHAISPDLTCSWTCSCVSRAISRSCASVSFGGQLPTPQGIKGHFKLSGEVFNHKPVYSQPMHDLGQGCKAYMWWGLSAQSKVDTSLLLNDVFQRDVMGWQVCVPHQANQCYNTVGDVTKGGCLGHKGYAYAHGDTSCPTDTLWSYCDDPNGCAFHITMFMVRTACAPTPVWAEEPPSLKTYIPPSRLASHPALI